MFYGKLSWRLTGKTSPGVGRNSGGNFPLWNLSIPLVSTRWGQAQPTKSAVGTIHKSLCRRRKRARIHPTRPGNVHQGVWRSTQTYILLEPSVHSMGSPSSAISTQKPRDTKPNGHVDFVGPDAASTHTHIIPISADSVNTPRNLLQIKGVTGNNSGVGIIHRADGTNRFWYNWRFLLARRRHHLHQHNSIKPNDQMARHHSTTRSRGHDRTNLRSGPITSTISVGTKART